MASLAKDVDVGRVQYLPFDVESPLGEKEGVPSHFPLLYPFLGRGPKRSLASRFKDKIPGSILSSLLLFQEWRSLQSELLFSTSTTSVESLLVVSPFGSPSVDGN